MQSRDHKRFLSVGEEVGLLAGATACAAEAANATGRRCCAQARRWCRWRRRPTTNKVTGDALTELTVEVVETDEVPVIAKSVQLREEIVVRTERTEHLETVRETVRQDEVEIEQANARHPARARA